MALNTLCVPLPYLFPQDHADLRNHFFTVGMKLEAVNVKEPFHICPASVTKVSSQKEGMKRSWLGTSYWFPPHLGKVKSGTSSAGEHIKKYV